MCWTFICSAATSCASRPARDQICLLCGPCSFTLLGAMRRNATRCSVIGRGSRFGGAGEELLVNDVAIRLRHVARVAALVLDELRDRARAHDLLPAWRQQRIEQHGRLLAGGEYFLHGVGCTATLAELTVNFDISAEGGHPIMDAHRICDALRSQAPPLFISVEALTAVLADLTAQGVVVSISDRGAAMYRVRLDAPLAE